LLRQAGIEPDRVVAPEIDESVRPAELPRAHALRLCAEKAEAVGGTRDGARAFVLAADTVVACGRRILPKAASEAEAARCLEMLSGRRHRVLTGVAVRAPDGELRRRLVTTTVGFKRLTGAEIACYLRSGEWQGKAGGYAIQGRAERFVRAINGSWSNVVGLPLYDAVNLLEGLGWRAPARC
jgi:septum formation protein